MKIWTVVISLFFLAGCATTQQPTLQPNLANIVSLRASMQDGMYDNHTFLVDQSSMKLESVADSLQHLKTLTTFLREDGEIETREMPGIAVVLKGKYLLTVDHVVSHYELAYETPYGKLVLPAKKISEETYLLHEGEEYLLKRLYSNRTEDMALLEAPDSLALVSFPYAIGNSDDLHIGNFIYLVGNPLNVGINVREGIVSSLDVPAIVSEVDVITENAFMVSNGLNPGDSGSPVVAIRDGDYELVGLSQGTFVVSQRMGWVIKINAVLKNIASKVDFRGRSFEFQTVAIDQ